MKKTNILLLALVLLATLSACNKFNENETASTDRGNYETMMHTEVSGYDMESILDLFQQEYLQDSETVYKLQPKEPYFGELPEKYNEQEELDFTTNPDGSLTVCGETYNLIEPGSPVDNYGWEVDLSQMVKRFQTGSCAILLPETSAACLCVVDYSSNQVSVYLRSDIFQHSPTAEDFTRFELDDTSLLPDGFTVQEFWTAHTTPVDNAPMLPIIDAPVESGMAYFGYLECDALRYCIGWFSYMDEVYIYNTTMNYLIKTG